MKYQKLPPKHLVLATLFLKNFIAADKTHEIFFKTLKTQKVELFGRFFEIDSTISSNSCQ
jgi:hypothetical protein